MNNIERGLASTLKVGGLAKTVDIPGEKPVDSYGGESVMLPSINGGTTVGKPKAVDKKASYSANDFIDKSKGNFGIEGMTEEGKLYATIFPDDLPDVPDDDYMEHHKLRVEKYIDVYNKITGDSESLANMESNNKHRSKYDYDRIVGKLADRMYPKDDMFVQNYEELYEGAWDGL